MRREARHGRHDRQRMIFAGVERAGGNRVSLEPESRGQAKHMRDVRVELAAQLSPPLAELPAIARGSAAELVQRELRRVLPARTRHQGHAVSPEAPRVVPQL